MKRDRWKIVFGLAIMFVLTACFPALGVQTGEPSAPLPAAVRTTTVQPGVTLDPETPQPRLTATVEPEQDFITLGYYTGSEESYRSVQSFFSILRIVSDDVYMVQKDGTLAGQDYLDVLQFDRDHGLLTLACVSNYNSDPQIDDFDPALAEAAIVTHKDALIAEIISLALEHGYDGVNIDLEDIAYSGDIEKDRNAFSAFINELARQLHAHDLMLAISVPGKVRDVPEDIWSYPYDFTVLGQAADYLQVMTYDEHGPWSEPGPVSSPGWVEDCLAYAVSAVDPSKLLIGLPAYGYNWNLTGSDPENGIYAATSFAWKDIPDLTGKPGAQTFWDEDAQSPYVTYTEDGDEHVAWFENERSIRAKTALVKTYHLAGLSVWALGLEDETFWQAALDGMK